MDPHLTHSVEDAQWAHVSPHAASSSLQIPTGRRRPASARTRRTPTNRKSASGLPSHFVPLNVQFKSPRPRGLYSPASPTTTPRRTITPHASSGSPLPAPVSAGRSKGRAVYAQDPEEMQHTILGLKQKVNQGEQQRTELRSRCQKLETELRKREKQVDDILAFREIIGVGSSAQFQHQRSENHLVTSLKRHIQQLKRVIDARDDELKRVRQDMRYSRVNELETELRTSFQECLRLRNLLTAQNRQAASDAESNEPRTTRYRHRHGHAHTRRRSGLITDAAPFAYETPGHGDASFVSDDEQMGDGDAMLVGAVLPETLSCDALRAKVMRLNGIIKRLKQSNRELEQEVERCYEENRVLREGAEARTQDSEDRFMPSESELVEMHDALSKMQTKLTQRREEAQAAKNESAALRDENKELSAQLEKERTRNSELLEELGQYEQLVAQYQQELGESRSATTKKSASPARQPARRPASAAKPAPKVATRSGFRAAAAHTPPSRPGTSTPRAFANKPAARISSAPARATRAAAVVPVKTAPVRPTPPPEPAPTPAAAAVPKPKPKPTPAPAPAPQPAPTPPARPSVSSAPPAKPPSVPPAAPSSSSAPSVPSPVSSAPSPAATPAPPPTPASPALSLPPARYFDSPQVPGPAPLGGSPSSLFPGAESNSDPPAPASTASAKPSPPAPALAPAPTPTSTPAPAPTPEPKPAPASSGPGTVSATPARAPPLISRGSSSALAPPTPKERSRSPLAESFAAVNTHPTPTTSTSTSTSTSTPAPKQPAPSPTSEFTPSPIRTATPAPATTPPAKGTGTSGESPSSLDMDDDGWLDESFSTDDPVPEIKAPKRETASPLSDAEIELGMLTTPKGNRSSSKPFTERTSAPLPTPEVQKAPEEPPPPAVATTPSEVIDQVSQLLQRFKEIPDPSSTESDPELELLKAATGDFSFTESSSFLATSPPGIKSGAPTAKLPTAPPKAETRVHHTHHPSTQLPLSAGVSPPGPGQQGQGQALPQLQTALSPRKRASGAKRPSPPGGIPLPAGLPTTETPRASRDPLRLSQELQSGRTSQSRMNSLMTKSIAALIGSSATSLDLGSARSLASADDVAAKADDILRNAMSALRGSAGNLSLTSIGSPNPLDDTNNPFDETNTTDFDMDPIP